MMKWCRHETVMTSSVLQIKGILSEISPTQMTVYTVKWQFVPVESSLIFVVSYEKIQDASWMGQADIAVEGQSEFVLFHGKKHMKWPLPCPWVNQLTQLLNSFWMWFDHLSYFKIKRFKLSQINYENDIFETCVSS